MQVRDGESGAGGLRRQAFFSRWRVEVIHRLGHAPEQKPRAHAAGEQHRDPRTGGKLRLIVIVAELDIGIGAHRQVDAQQHEHRAGEHEQPIEILQGTAGQSDGGSGHMVRRDYAPNADNRGQSQGDNQNQVLRHWVAPPIRLLI
jgi:hypothetical protein